MAHPAFLTQVRRRFAGVAAVVAIAGAVPPIPVVAAAAPSAVPVKPDDRTIVHVLNRLGFGPRPGDVERVRLMGLAAYIEQQLQPARVQDGAVNARLARLETVSLSSTRLFRDYYLPALEARRDRKNADTGAAPSPLPVEMSRQRQVLGELTEQKLLRAVYSERQLQEVLTDFWFNHFNVFAGKNLVRVFVTEYEREAIRPYVLGGFRDLLGATAHSPAMLFYLDNARSADPKMAERVMQDVNGGRRLNRADGRARRPIDPERQAQIVERLRKNLPTGINENYARELMELHTLGVDGGYTQQDIVAVARAFTGWTIGRPGSGDEGTFRFEPRMHDSGEKNVLGHTIKAGGGMDDGERVLDILARHPSTATFIATKLVRRFVSDDPPSGLVERARARFRETDGNIREVVKTIVTSPEFFAPEAYRAKVKTPFEFVVSALRSTGADVAAALPLARTLQMLGMPLYMCQPPTGYKDTADAWVNTGALINRMNFAVSLSNQQLRGVTLGDAWREPLTADQAVLQLLGGDASEPTRATIGKASTTPQLLALALGAPEFQRK
jgi:uncharacterized protein (DUF1800 family)